MRRAMSPVLLPDLLLRTAERHPERPALSHGAASLQYAALCSQVVAVGAGLAGLGLQRGERVALYLDKCLELVVGCFGTCAAGGVMVPLNPVLKGAQVEHILRDSGARVLVTSAGRLQGLQQALARAPGLQMVVIVGDPPATPLPAGLAWRPWSELLGAGGSAPGRRIDRDVAAILYTSGSTGLAKGVVLSHCNLVAGAVSVAGYLGNHADDTLLAVLPLSFDAGFSQLTTGFLSGARVVLLNHLLPGDVLRAMAQERITGITAVPPLFIQLAQLEWPAAVGEHLRYFANTGGRLPRETLNALRQRVPAARPYLMYGLTEAFRSTYLPPQEIDRRPDSIGKAIPNAEILVLREDGTPCDPDEPGELVHRGALVSLGYWRDPVRTAERFRPLPTAQADLPLPEIAVFSGDTVRRDAEGFLYFVGRQDEMIKSSGYRISPTEVEEALYSTGLVGECAAFGVPHAVLGQVVRVVVTAAGDRPLDADALLKACRSVLPAYMVPTQVELRDGPLPRSPNGKIDRKLLADAAPAAPHE
jgi:acyl-CoA ligase (AMP-forming) (exosortase A-associated)